MIKEKISQLFESEKIKQQIYKLLQALIICTFLLLVVEIIFQIPTVSKLFSNSALEDAMGNNIMIWIILWLLMFAQVTIIPIPAMPIYVFCNNTALVSYGSGLIDLFSLRTLFFVLYVTSACVVGAIAAYWLGRTGGKKAVKWIAGEEEDYQLWCKKLNCKAGKWIYAATVLLPIFPDDIICLVVGSMKMNFKFYTLVNLINRFIGAYTILLFMRLPIINSFFTSAVNGDFPWALLVYSILFIIVLIITIIWKKKVLNKSV